MSDFDISEDAFVCSIANYNVIATFNGSERLLELPNLDPKPLGDPSLMEASLIPEGKFIPDEPGSQDRQDEAEKFLRNAREQLSQCSNTVSTLCTAVRKFVTRARFLAGNYSVDRYEEKFGRDSELSTEQVVDILNQYYHAFVYEIAVTFGAARPPPIWDDEFYNREKGNLQYPNRSTGLPEVLQSRFCAALCLWDQDHQDKLCTSVSVWKTHESKYNEALDIQTKWESLDELGNLLEAVVSGSEVFKGPRSPHHVVVTDLRHVYNCVLAAARRVYPQLAKDLDLPPWELDEDWDPEKILEFDSLPEKEYTLAQPIGFRDSELASNNMGIIEPFWDH